MNQSLGGVDFRLILRFVQGRGGLRQTLEGSVRIGQTIKMMHTGKEFTVTELGYLRAGGQVPSEELLAGEVGYICASIKNVRDCRVGDTITIASNPAKEPLPGYKKAVPMVFCGIYPADGSKIQRLRMP